jgi:hypothetical protein
MLAAGSGMAAQSATRARSYRRRPHRLRRRSPASRRKRTSAARVVVLPELTASDAAWTLIAMMHAPHNMARLLRRRAQPG